MLVNNSHKRVLQHQKEFMQNEYSCPVNEECCV